MLEERWSCDALLLHVRARVKPRLFEVLEVQPKWAKSWPDRESANDPRCAKRWTIHPFWPRFVRCTCILKVVRRDLEWHLSRKSRDVCFWWWLKVCENRENKQIRRCGELQMWCHRLLESHPWTFLPGNMKGCVIICSFEASWEFSKTFLGWKTTVEIPPKKSQKLNLEILRF